MKQGAKSALPAIYSACKRWKWLLKSLLRLWFLLVCVHELGNLHDNSLFEPSELRVLVDQLHAVLPLQNALEVLDRDSFGVEVLDVVL